jgi:hypothetical protein
MTRWIGIAALASTLLLANGARIDVAAAAPALQKPAAQSTDVSARRRYREHYHHYAYKPYYPYYYGRPAYYSPGPFFLPVPPFWNYGWEWW